MTNPFFRTVIVTGVLAWCLLGSIAHAQGPMTPPMAAPGIPLGVGPGMGMPMVPGMYPRRAMNPLATLDLTQAQLDKLDAIGKQARAASVDLMTKIGDELVELRSLIAAASLDPEEIGSTYQKIFNIQRQVIESSVASYNKQVAVLNPEQLKKWNAFRQRIIARWLPPAGSPAQN